MFEIRRSFDSNFHSVLLSHSYLVINSAVLLNLTDAFFEKSSFCLRFFGKFLLYQKCEALACETLFIVDGTKQCKVKAVSVGVIDVFDCAFRRAGVIEHFECTEHANAKKLAISNVQKAFRCANVAFPQRSRFLCV